MIDLGSDFSMEDLAGKYLFVIYDDFEGEVYGGYELFADGTYTWNWGPDDETNFDESQHFAGGGSGTWAISKNDPSRLIYTEDGENYTGTVYPGKAMLIDNGEGGGFILGINYPSTHATVSSVAGTYRVLDLTLEGETGVGYYTIDGSGGPFTYYLKYDGSSGEDSGSSDDFQVVNEVNNMFKGSVVYDDETFWTYFALLPGEILLHFCVGDEMGLVSYGVGAKIN